MLVVADQQGQRAKEPVLREDHEVEHVGHQSGIVEGQIVKVVGQVFECHEFIVAQSPAVTASSSTATSDGVDGPCAPLGAPHGAPGG